MPFSWLDDLGRRFTTGEKQIQPHLAGAHAHLSVHVLGISNHAMVEHRPNLDSATPYSPLQARKLSCIVPTLLYSPDAGSVGRG